MRWCAPTPPHSGRDRMATLWLSWGQTKGVSSHTCKAVRLHAIQAYLSLDLITHSHSPSFSRRWLVVCLLRYDPRRCSRSPTPFDSLYTCVATTFVCAMRFWLSFTLFLSLVWLSRTLLICLTLLHAFFLYGSKLVSGHPFPFVAVLFRCGGVGQPGTAGEGGFGA